MSPSASAAPLWTPKEELDLLTLRNTHPDVSWSELAKRFNEGRETLRCRTATSIRKKWKALKDKRHLVLEPTSPSQTATFPNYTQSDMLPWCADIAVWLNTLPDPSGVGWYSGDCFWYGCSDVEEWMQQAYGGEHIVKLKG